MPSQIEIAIASLQRLVKEESSYHKELDQQKARLTKLEAGTSLEDENLDYQIKQERQAIEETQKIIPSLKKRIGEGVEKLEKILEESKRDEDLPSVESINKAKEAIAAAKSSMREAS